MIDSKKGTNSTPNNKLVASSPRLQPKQEWQKNICHEPSTPAFSLEVSHKDMKEV